MRECCQLTLSQGEGVSHLAAVVWTVDGTSREAASLQRQAELISQFGREEGGCGDGVWERVLIVVKCPQAEVQEEAGGALAAAERAGAGAGQLSLEGFSILERLAEDRQAFWLRQPGRDRENMAILRAEEARERLVAALQAMPHPAQVLWVTARCEDCGVESDPRLLPERCHTERRQVHTGGVRRRHTGNWVRRRRWHGHLMTNIKKVGTMDKYIECLRV